MISRRTQPKMLIFGFSILLLGGGLIWCLVGSSSDMSNRASAESYSRKELLAESMETYEELKEQGIRAFGGYVSSQYNIAVVMVHPEDAGKLQLTQNDVPDMKYFKLIQKGEEIPVYIELEFQPTHPVGLN